MGWVKEKKIVRGRKSHENGVERRKTEGKTRGHIAGMEEEKKISVSRDEELNSKERGNKGK